MRLNILRLISVLAIAMLPLSAGAVSAGAALAPDAGTRQITAAADRCLAGYYWEAASYAPHGKWRPAHCAPR
jgi:hypothetical protein